MLMFPVKYPNNARRLIIKNNYIPPILVIAAYNLVLNNTDETIRVLILFRDTPLTAKQACRYPPVADIVACAQR